METALARFYSFLLRAEPADVTYPLETASARQASDFGPQLANTGRW